MFYSLLKFYARLVIKIYCRKIVINKPECLGLKGPLLLAANHPNSWLDGVILTTLFDQNIFSLARGDAFRKNWHSKILNKLHLLPVYRTSEGVENLENNYTTFSACQNVFANKGIVLIFSEGRCKNEWKLRPLKKGTARLAVSTWTKNIDLTVLPVAFNYNSFRNFGKNVFINFGDPLNKEEVLHQQSDGKIFLSFNEQLHNQLNRLVYQISGEDIEQQKKRLSISVSTTKKILLAVPAVIGLITHAPLFFAAKALTKTFFDNDHFDSAVVSMLMFFYPVFIVATAIVAYMFMGWATAIAAIIILPFSAWSVVQLKPQHG